MSKKILVIRTACLLGLAASLFAEGTVSQSLQQLGGPTGKSWVVAFHAVGDATTGHIPVATAQIGLAAILQGYFITACEIAPRTPAPTAGYGLTVRDQAGVDVLAGAAASLSASTPAAFSASTSLPPINGTFSLAITGNSVAGARTDVYVYMQAPDTLIGSGSPGSAGAPGTPGTDGLSILNGSGTPSSGLGVNGDFYLDTGSTRLYGPKSGGLWGSGITLIGPTGATGAAGAAGTNGHSVLNGIGAPSGGTGADGDFYIDTAASNLYGPKTSGSWGSPTSLIGPQGPPGSVITLGPLQFLQGKPDQTSPTQQAADLPYFLTSDYDFPAQTPGGTLTATVGASATLTPCPLGVDGSDANHYYRISGGTGTAETVLGTGGSCTSAASSGTITFTPANNHSGAWAFASASSGAREAILASGGNAVIKLPSNATLLISGTNGLVVDKQNLIIQGCGWGSVVQALAGQNLNAVIKATAANGTRFFNFTIDGNRSSAGTNPTFGAGIECGTDATGNCSHTIFQGLQIFHSANMGILVHDANVDVTIRNNYIHDNGGVTDGSGTGQAIFFYRASLSDAKVTGCVIDSNYIADNHNTITNAGPSGGTAVQGSCDIVNNYYVNNYNDGGQVGCFGYANGPCTISGNTFIVTSTGLVEHTSGIETDSSGIQITDNKIYLHTHGWCIAVEGASAGPGGLGASDVTMTGNQCTSANIGIGLLNAGGFVRGIVMANNRVAAGNSGTGNGLQVDTAADSCVATGNNFSDSPNPVVDGSADGCYLSNNFPMAANLVYGGTVASAGHIAMRCNQAAKISGSASITDIDLPAETASTNGAGCMVSLIPAAGATWSLASSGNISVAIATVTAGRPILLVSDGSKFNPLTSASLPAVTALQYLRGNEITSAIEGANLPFFIAPDYNFPAQAPGGSVSIGSNTKTLTPCPLGVGGSDARHYLYLSAGSGTAEAVLIAGGTCTSGATSGTIVFTAANTHSGAWTVTSATAGIQEAINVLPSQGGRVLMPAASSPYVLHQTVSAGNGSASATSTVDGITLQGDGSGNTDSEAFPITAATMLQWDGPAGGTMLDIEGPISGMRVSGIYFKCNGANRAATGLLSNHSFNSHFSNFQFNGCSGYAIKNYAYGNPVGIVTGANNDIWEQISIYSGGSATASGMQVGAGAFTLGDFVDVAQNFFRKLQIGAGASGTALDLRLTDSLTFDSLTTTSGATGILVDEVIGAGFHFPQAITFNMPNLAGVTTVLDDSSWTGTLIGGWFWPYNNDNDTLADPIGTKGWSAGVSNNGRFWGAFQSTPTVYTSVASSTAIASTVTETAFSKSFDLPAKSINAVGTRVRVTASGRYSTTGTPTMQLAMKVAGNPFSVVPTTTTLNNASNAGWSFTGEFVVRVPGASGTAQNGHGIGGLGGTTPSVAAWVNNFTLDTTAAETVTVTATWGTSSASNSIILDVLAVEILASGKH